MTKVKYTGSSDPSLVNLKKLNSDKTVRQLLLDNGMALVSTSTVPNDASNSLASISQVYVQAQSDKPGNIHLPCAKPTPTVSTQHTQFVDATALHVGAVVNVVHVVSPADFYVIDAAGLREMMSLSQKLKQHCESESITSSSEVLC